MQLNEIWRSIFNKKEKWLLNGHMPSKNYCLIDLEYYLLCGSYLQTPFYAFCALLYREGEKCNLMVSFWSNKHQ